MSNRLQSSSVTHLDLKKVTLIQQNGHPSINQLDLRVNHFERVAIIGSSGSGKTTLLSILGTALKPSSGEYLVNTKNPWSLSREKLRQLRTQIGFIYQAPPLPLKQRVITSVLAGKLGKWPIWKSMLSLLYPMDIAGPQNILEKLKLSEALFVRCDTLSGGELQRVGIARVLYQDPELILADEPISALDPVLSELIIEQILHHQQKTIVVSLHDVEVALKWFPRIIGLKEGQLQFDLPAEEVTEEMLAALYSSATVA
ncbi:phosphonate ABC transporter ATP-binding protein [Polynucleobacter kasalickyi]|uniref:Phosphonate transport system ATP-binding protein n=1 Tax=Polynucleobacter kasalickyi TaxID=1938817 RepID=A0A1W1Z567_9BURK|nr:ATP-binding cassette domain-containing protein [Polynucleobacter kasalickyi]SMC43261.1 phosphonate transport system ATP-binding protein [Polynucleobacter kasalickyi]